MNLYFFTMSYGSLKAWKETEGNFTDKESNIVLWWMKPMYKIRMLREKRTDISGIQSAKLP